MNLQKILAVVFVLIAMGLGFDFHSDISYPEGPGGYFKNDYIGQFGPLAICVELLVAGIHLFRSHPKANFTLALFGFTALLDPVFNAVGLITTNVPVYGTMLFIFCAIPALWIAFTNTFDLGRISWPRAAGSFVLGILVELFFNDW